MPALIVVRVLAIVAVTLLISLPVQSESQNQVIILKVDNYGGYSHGGRRILVFSDGGCEEVIYSDFVGDERKRQGHCVIDRTGRTLIIKFEKSKSENLLATNYDGTQYWVHKNDTDRLKKPSESWLRQTSLRNRR